MEERKEAVRDQFNKAADRYNSRYLTPEKLRELSRILGMLKCNNRLARVLDLGCGPAIISSDLLKISEQVYGIDLSGDMIRNAKLRFCGTCNEHKVFFSVGDAENLDFPDNFFDAVICLGVLRYLDSPERGLREIYRVLKPKGVLLSTFYHRYSIYWLSMMIFYRPLLPLLSLIKKESLSDLKTRYKAEPSPFSYKKFRKIFAETGFGHAETLHSGVSMFPLNYLFPEASRSINLKTEELLLRSGIFGWMGSICIVKGIKL